MKINIKDIKLIQMKEKIRGRVILDLAKVRCPSTDEMWHLYTYNGVLFCHKKNIAEAFLGKGVHKNIILSGTNVTQV